MPTFGSGDINPFDLPAPELIDRVEAQSPREIQSWRDIGAQEYARSFTAAQTAGYDVVRDLYDGYLATISTPGQTGEDFASRVTPILRAKGWLPGEGDQQLARRLNLIYETNLRTGQAVGYWQRIQRGKLGFPYLYSFTARDERVRHPPKSKHSDHRAFEHILLPVDHPFWQDYFPPLGFRCRCSVVPKTRSQAARLGGETNPAELADRIARLGEPWGFNPGMDPLGPTEAAAEQSNAERLEGLPPIEPMRIRAGATSLWDSMVAGKATVLIESIIARLFGDAPPLLPPS